MLDLATVKNFLRCEHDEDDELIQMYIESAEDYVKSACGDNVDLEKVINIKEVCYTWNRMNTTNSVSIVRNSYWNASAWCHIGHQLQLLDQLKHKEMIPILKKRIKECQDLINHGVYQQY